MHQYVVALHALHMKRAIPQRRRRRHGKAPFSLVTTIYIHALMLYGQSGRLSGLIRLHGDQSKSCLSPDVRPTEMIARQASNKREAC